MKKHYSLLLLALLILLVALPVAATENGMTYAFQLTANGKDTIEAEYGDIITLVVKLRRTDAQAAYEMYGMQAELRYDSAFLELVPNSAITYEEIATADVELADGYREFYMNFLSMTGGTKWEPEVVLGTVQFKVIGTSGVSKITNEDYLVSLADGTGGYECTSNELFIVLSTECKVTFHSNGGTAVESQTVQFGEKVTRPKDPVREGYRFAGWYRDIHLTEEWDFDTDVVQSNMSLYAKWEEGDPEETEPTQPTEPGEPGQTEPNNLGWLWWILLLLILLVAAWVYWRYHKDKRDNT